MRIPNASDRAAIDSASDDLPSRSHRTAGRSDCDIRSCDSELMASRLPHASSSRDEGNSRPGGVCGCGSHHRKDTTRSRRAEDDKNGKVKKSELPDTVRKSPKKAQKTFAKAHDAAAKSYGEGERAHRTAYSALKHSFEKVGDHWEKKGRNGPSDARAERGGRNRLPTAEGVDAKASKEHLMHVAKRLDIRGRSRMTKADLVEAIKKANRRASARARAS